MRQFDMLNLAADDGNELFSMSPDGVVGRDRVPSLSKGGVWRLAILAAERRYNFSHGREPVVFDWHSALAPLGAAQLLCRP